MKMKAQGQANLITSSSLALAVALAIWFPVQARSAEPAEGKKLMEGKMMEGCKEMKAQKQKMKEDMKTQDTELTEHVAKMNSAPEDKKVDIMAAVQANHFGVMQVHNLKETMVKKGVDFARECLSFEVCQPQQGQAGPR